MGPTSQLHDTSLGAVVLAPSAGDDFWPVMTRWRAVVTQGNRFRAPEWMLRQVKAVPLSSRIERSLLEAVRSDDGRTVLERASEPGEHRVAAAVIAALRLASSNPERALSFLAWTRKAPDDPSDLRFLRRYLPGLYVLVRPDPSIGVAIPLSHDALDLLAAELFRQMGNVEQADKVLASMNPSAPVALARASLRLSAGDYPGVHTLAQNRPIVDDVTVALRVIDANACEQEGNAAAALATLEPALTHPGVGGPVEKMALASRARALRASGRAVEASLIEEDFGSAAGAADIEVGAEPEPSPPMYGRNLSDALDDAWARVRRQHSTQPVEPLDDPGAIDSLCEQVIVLIHAGHHETAEATLLAGMDRCDAWVDAGGPVVDELFIILAGLFNQLGMAPEEVATLERLRDAHQRAGSELPDEVLARLVEVRTALDELAGEA